MISRKTNFKPQSVFRVETITSTQTRIFWLKNSMKFGFSFFAKKFDKIRKKKNFVKKCDEQLKSFYHRLDAHYCDLRKVDSLLIDPASPSSSEQLPGCSGLALDLGQRKDRNGDLERSRRDLDRFFSLEVLPRRPETKIQKHKGNSVKNQAMQKSINFWFNWQIIC